MTIRLADRDRDAEVVWALLEPTFRAGETYAIDPDVGREEALDWWFGGGHDVFLATGDGDELIGTYYLGPNHGGGGEHVANCGYVVASSARGRGVGRRLCADSLERARRRGYEAMQFNLVVSTNRAAIRVWRSMGFEIVGRIPDGFDHPDEGRVDAYVMHRPLASAGRRGDADLIDRVAEVLRDAGRAHHDAFADVDGEDPEWPLWYAEHLLGRLRALLGADLTRSQLVHTLLSAEEDARVDPAEDWTASYARYLVARHAGDRAR